MEMVQWKVEGMTCANCALTIRKYLENQGQQNVKVNPIDGDVSFELVDSSVPEKLIKGIQGLGYYVKPENDQAQQVRRPFLHNHLRRFFFCLPFTLVLMLHMLDGVIHIHWLMNPWVQLAICLPVYFVGMSFFGRSAIKSLRNGIPNMNVLIALGATAAFVYSLIGTLMGWGSQYLFYETAATIITLVFFGNYLEDASIDSTQRELKKLAKSQKLMANMIAFDGEHQEVILPIENTQLKVGDLVLIKSGEQVPIDCKILSGEAHVSEAIITGESVPIHKVGKDKLIGGSIVEDGLVRAMVTATGENTVLSNILRMVKQAQGEKPPVQKMADRISAIFVPVVIGIALLTLALNWMIIGEFTTALMRSIAVLVIACPCAMGLATPAAIAVGLGRGARSGILFRNATSLESFKDIKQVVFDKTGTLTTGNFSISSYQVTDPTMDDDQFRRILYSLEKYSNHPIARAVGNSWKTKNDIRWQKVEEVKGLGMKGTDKEGREYFAGSYAAATELTSDKTHNVYVIVDGKLAGFVDMADEVRPEAAEVVNYLHSKNIKTILLSGDRIEACQKLAASLGIREVIAEQTPQQKLEKIASLTEQAPTAMVGDGINDAPALAKATIGVSMSDASQIAMQSAQVVLMNHGLTNLPTALGLGKHTYLTIKQNLFWAFFYNIFAIPFAAFGFLMPWVAALVMGLSDVVLAINSVRLFVKKVV
ncbi:MAG TPA: cation-translocating P-type ATPase [Chitinophagaceae bacterium]|nr:cation-translocating P-type ATPase [Chitinophagaceae bacterium]